MRGGHPAAGRNHSPPAAAETTHWPPADAAETGSGHGGASVAASSVDAARAGECAGCSAAEPAASGGGLRKTWISVEGKVAPELPGRTARRLRTAGPAAATPVGTGTAAEVFSPDSTCRESAHVDNLVVSDGAQRTSLLYANIPSI